MDYGTYTENTYDSDFIDEDIESRLYSAVFFETSNYTPKPYGLVSKQTHPDFNGSSFSHQSKPCKSPVAEHVNDSTDDPLNSLTASVPDKTFPFEDNCEKNDEGNLSSSSSSGCSILLCCDDSSQTVISTQGVVLGVSHDTLLHVRNEDGSSEVLKQVVSNSDSGLWEICNADRHSSQSAGGRYFNSSDNQLCSECGGRRWRMHKCRVCCIFCGEEGHEKSECDKIYCYACLAPGHTKDTCHLLTDLKKSIASDVVSRDIIQRCVPNYGDSTETLLRKVSQYVYTAA
ncbi:unnamed protein product [Heterobilharzia americana]|nr:unnamed protein product [Heterobilharzia americana]